MKLEPHIVTNPRHWTKFQAHQLYNDLKAWLLKQAGMVQGMGIRHSDIALTLEERIREELPILIDIVFATKALPRDVRRTITNSTRCCWSTSFWHSPFNTETSKRREREYLLWGRRRITAKANRL